MHLLGMDRHFADAGVARQRFLEFYAKSSGFAVWTINNRPEVLGTLQDPAGQKPWFNPKEAQLSSAWCSEAANCLAIPTPRSQVVAQAVAGIEQSARRQAASRRHGRRAEYGRQIAIRAAARFGELPGAAPAQHSPESTRAKETTERPGNWSRLLGHARGSAEPKLGNEAPGTQPHAPDAAKRKEAPWTERVATQPVQRRNGRPPQPTINPSPSRENKETHAGSRPRRNRQRDSE